MMGLSRHGPLVLIDPVMPCTRITRRMALVGRFRVPRSRRKALAQPGCAYVCDQLDCVHYS